MAMMDQTSPAVKRPATQLLYETTWWREVTKAPLAYLAGKVTLRSKEMPTVDWLTARRATLFGIAIFTSLLFDTSCGAGSSPRSDDIAEKAKDLMGNWKKISSAQCDERYPDELEFFEATYLGKKSESRPRFIWWDAGSYRIIAADRVKIDIATDEQIVYRFSISEEVLTFANEEGCVFKYQRVV